MVFIEKLFQQVEKLFSKQCTTNSTDFESQNNMERIQRLSFPPPERLSIAAETKQEKSVAFHDFPAGVHRYSWLQSQDSAGKYSTKPFPRARVEAHARIVTNAGGLHDWGKLMITGQSTAVLTGVQVSG